MRITHQEAQQIQDALFAKALSIVTAKRHDYSGDTDPLANFRLAELVGVSPVQGAMVRTLTEKGTVNGKVNESLVDTFADILNYTALIACLLAEEYPEFKDSLLAVQQPANQPERTLYTIHIPLVSGNE